MNSYLENQDDSDDGSAIEMARTGLAVADGTKPTEEASLVHSRPPISRGSEIIWLLLLLILGSGLRYAAAEALPAQCIGSECTALMMSADPTSLPQIDASVLLTSLIRLLSPIVESPLDAIRLAGVVVGSLTLLGFYLFARQVVLASAALVATALLVQSPWHIWSSSVADNRIMLPLLICVSGWLLYTTFQLRSRIGLLCLVGAGIGLGLLWIESSFLQVMPILWAAWVVLITMYALSPWGWQSILGGSILLISGLFGTLSISINLGWLVTPLTFASVPSGEISSDIWTDLFRNLFYQGNFGAAGNLLDGSLSGLLLAGLAVVGLGSLVRLWWRPSSLVLIGGIISAFVGLWIAISSGKPDSILDPPASLLLILLPFLFGLAAVAIEQFIDAMQVSWRPLFDTRQVALAVLALALLLPAINAGDLFDKLRSVSGSADSPLDGLLTTYLTEALPDVEGRNVTYFVPADYMAKPTTALQLGPSFDAAKADGRIRAFDPLQDLFFISPPAGDLTYLLDGNDPSLIELLQQILPGGRVEPQPILNEDDPTQLVLYHVSTDTILANQGLRGTYHEGNDPSALSQPSFFSQDHESLTGDWSALPVQGPFSARREGTLMIPQSGSYSFWAESHPEAQLTLYADNIPILDTSQGIDVALDVPLARGPYHIRLGYQSESVASGAQPANFDITWQSPEGNRESIPVTLLQASAPPKAGLLGTYYEGGRFDAPPLFMQKDLLLGVNAALPKPYSVRWRGKVAASRGGEYMVGVLTDGQVLLQINGQLLIDSTRDNPSQGEEAEEENQNDNTDGSEDQRRYAEGLIYLPQGWHDIELAYVTTEDASPPDYPSLELFWLPPGGEPEALPMSSLLPLMGGLSQLDYPLPPPSSLASPLLGNDFFALSKLQSPPEPQLGVTMATLPPFNAQPLWQTSAGCGAGSPQLLEPHGIAIDPLSGDIYVADTGNQRVVTYNLDGSWERFYGSEQFVEPFDLAMQNDRVSGTVQPLLLDAVSQQIFRLNPQASIDDAIVPLAINTSFYRPRGFGTDAAGNIAVADTGGGRVVLLSSEGQVMQEIGGRETLFGLGQPVDAVPIAGRLWAITAEDGRLWLLTGRGEASGSISAVKATNTLNGPRLAALANGAIFVVDPVQRKVIFHTPQGQPLLEWTDPGFIEPVGIDVATVNNQLLMAIMDRASCTLSLWQLDGSPFGF
ncbi:MAG: PA14 domain-containing protein [Chloroflexota bacterium]